MGLAAAGGPEEQDVALGELDLIATTDACALLILDAAVVVVDRDREDLLGLVLAHDRALALYRKLEYAKVGMPMLPVTHGDKFTRLHVLLYTLILIAVTLMPYATQMSGLIYLVGAVVLDAVFLYYAVKIHLDYSDQIARKAFRYSIFYLAALFVVLLVDHYIRF